jgi:sigma-B regulation protein RsbU (phosphoserine phosphatase)
MNSQKKLRQILEITRMMMATGDLDSLLRVVIDNSLQLLDAERASILLYDPLHNELISHIAIGEEEIRFPADCGIAGATISARSTINVPDAYADVRFNSAIDENTGFCTHNILSLPLYDFAEELVGVLQVLNKRSGQFDTDDEQLAATLAAQAGVCLQRARLMAHYHEKMEMERAMEIAREIQQSLLPKSNPTIEGFDVAGLSVPADRTGGDMFDFISLKDDCWLVIVADASGHGIGPALVVAETRAMLRTANLFRHDPCHLLTTVNQLLTADLDGRFVTCFVGLLDPLSQSLTYASAGHGPIIFYNCKNNHFTQSPATSLPLGLFANTDYSEVVTHTFAPGDFALIATDGFFEMTNPDGAMYGTDRMIACVQQNCEADANQMLLKLHVEVTTFLQTEAPQDDCTGVVIKYSPG